MNRDRIGRRWFDLILFDLFGLKQKVTPQNKSGNIRFISYPITINQNHFEIIEL